MKPLAERMRPTDIKDFVGQEKIVGPQGPLSTLIANGHVPSLILWGPPGVGKTTLARIIARTQKRLFISISAINSGVKAIRDAIKKAEESAFFDRAAPILFIDEIHRFSKSQQDALLGAVEKGTLTLIGATTENPSFEVNAALLSRCQVYILESLSRSDIRLLLERAIAKDLTLQSKNIVIKEDEALYRYSGGDVRKAYNILELVVADRDTVEITNALVSKSLQGQMSRYDKSGEQHYDIVSAFIKSIRGSDPDATVYWLARMLHGGEDIKFIARRMVISASEDIGLANPNALLLANACFDAVAKIGMPEARIVLSQTAIYLAMSPKSNSTYRAIDSALEEVRRSGDLSVPLHLRNAPTPLMKDLGYGEGYRYPHDYEGNMIDQNYLPEKLRGKQFYFSGDNHKERQDALRLKGNKKSDLK